MLNKILDVALLLAVAIASAVIVATSATIFGVSNETAHKATTAPTSAVTQQTTLQPTQVPTATTQPATTATAPEQTTAATQPTVILYDVPLSPELQLFIIDYAESHGIDPAIIFAMIWRESTFDASAIGDGGESFGLMQIQPKWNMELMEDLNCMNLLDPYQNVMVGISVLAYQRDRYDGDIAKAIVSYNQGHFYGTITQYAKDVLGKAEELRGTTYVQHGQ